MYLSALHGVWNNHPIRFSLDVELCNIVYKLAPVCEMTATSFRLCIFFFFAHTCLFKGHLVSHCNAEARIDVFTD